MLIFICFIHYLGVYYMVILNKQNNTKKQKMYNWNWIFVGGQQQQISQIIQNGIQDWLRFIFDLFPIQCSIQLLWLLLLSNKYIFTSNGLRSKLNKCKAISIDWKINPCTEIDLMNLLGHLVLAVVRLLLPSFT